VAGELPEESLIVTGTLGDASGKVS